MSTRPRSRLARKQPPAGRKAGALQYKVGFLGLPSSTERKMHLPVTWNEENLERLAALGFNTIQINVAWGSRPADEALNLEDVVELSAEQAREFPQTVPLRCDPSPERRVARQAELRERIALCQQAGMRTIFHFGAPYNAHGRYGDAPPNCLLDPKVTQRYVLLIDKFAETFPGVDDILLYTYDQDAWLCNEFGPCPRCLGVPLHERLIPFIDRLAAAWRKHSPRGRLWWEPWELSAGQALKCVAALNPKGLGLALHSNITEVMAAFPVDRWFRNTCHLASQRGIPVMAEHFLGGASEELEPLLNLAHPLVTLRAMQTMAAVPGVTGLKEYYGLAPDREDPNLRMAGLFFQNPQIGEEQALRALAKPYSAAAEKVMGFWRLTSDSMLHFPWDTSWMIREIGKSDPAHSLSFAILRGMRTHTPSWMSTRRSMFMRVEPDYPPDSWALEDVQLRCELAAERMEQALALGAKIRVSKELAKSFAATLVDLAKFRRRALAYAYHLRESNLIFIIRRARKENQPVPARAVTELGQVLNADADNFHAEQRVAHAAGAPLPDWKEMEDARQLFARDLDQFLARYFQECPDKMSKGVFSVTST